MLLLQLFITLKEETLIDKETKGLRKCDECGNLEAPKGNFLEALAILLEIRLD